MGKLGLGTLALSMLIGQPAIAQDGLLPAPGGRPMAVAADDDPLVALGRETLSSASFRTLMAAVVARNPGVGEGAANAAEALAVRREAKSARFPTVDLGFTSNRSLARDYSNDPDNVVERSRGKGRTDASASAQLLLFDFGATGRRIQAATARVDGSDADLDRAREAVALRAIGAWYDLFATSRMVSLAQSHAQQLDALRPAIEMRIRQGVSAPIERARLTSVIASARATLASFERQRANAAARYAELFGDETGTVPVRLPPPETGLQSKALVAQLATTTPLVIAAEAEARAARAEAQAARATRLPTVTAGLDAGRYGLFEQGRTDYDVRARITLRQSLLGPGAARSDQAKARADAARFRAEGVKEEAAREAAIAWSDVSALDQLMAAREADYLASRQLRDAETERFRLYRGTLFDVIDTQERAYAGAAAYLQTMSELDTARYILLARTGQLLGSIGLEKASRGQMR